jgi:hypothetical protein
MRQRAMLCLTMIGVVLIVAQDATAWPRLRHRRCICAVQGQAPGTVKEPDPTVESVLARWEEASHKCRTLDAKVTVFHYDDVFGQGDRPTITQGRFYYETPNIGRYETSAGGKGTPNDWLRVSEAIVWQGDKTLLINGPERTCWRFSPARLVQAAKTQTAAVTADNAPSGFFAALGRALAQLQHALSGPREFLPLVIDIHADEVRERFHLTLEHGGEEILLKAVPNPSLGHACYREIGVILNAKTYLTHAIQVVLPGGKERVVYVLDDQKVNQTPDDRDQLLNPNLFGFRLVDEGP